MSVNLAKRKIKFEKTIYVGIPGVLYNRKEGIVEENMRLVKILSSKLRRFAEYGSFILLTVLELSIFHPCPRY